MDLYAIDVGAGTDANFGGFCTVNDGFGGGDDAQVKAVIGQYQVRNLCHFRALHTGKLAFVSQVGLNAVAKKTSETKAVSRDNLKKRLAEKRAKMEYKAQQALAILNDGE